MTALETILIIVLCVIVVFIVTVILFIKPIALMLTKQVVHYEIMNDFAPKDPIIFLGDSITAHYPIHEFFHDDRILNRGISGETTFDVKKRLHTITDLKPRAVFLLIGINDFIKEEKKSKPFEVAKRVIEIADELSKTCEDIRIVSIFPINKKRKKITRIYLNLPTNSKILLTNSLIEKACLDKGYKFLNYYNHLINSQGVISDNYTLEGLHLTLEGYAKLSPFVLKELEEIK